MLLSMTGYGAATAEADGFRVAVELRTVNNRFLKIQARVPDRLGDWENQVEKLVRETLKRGSVTVSVRLTSSQTLVRPRLHPEVLQGYLADLRAAGMAASESEPALLASLLALPGVVEERDEPLDGEALWACAAAALSQALVELERMRAAEGEATRLEMCRLRERMAAAVADIATWAESAADTYREQLLQRVRRVLAATDVTLDARDVLREVCLYADRADIAEEISRFRSHLQQLDRLLDDSESQGRKIDFLTQELLRETNTMGSKAADARICQRVVDLKCEIERLREIVQNVE